MAKRITYEWARTFISLQRGRFSKVHLVKYRDDDYAVAACNHNTILTSIPTEIDNVQGDDICFKCWLIKYNPAPRDE